MNYKENIKREINELLSDVNEKLYVYDVTAYRLEKDSNQEKIKEEWLVEDFDVFEDFKLMVDFEFVVTNEELKVLTPVMIVDKRIIGIDSYDRVVIKEIMEELKLYRGSDEEKREYTVNGMYENEARLMEKLNIEIK